MSTFNFRIINLPDGNQIIDSTLKTPYSALTPLQMVEYIETDNRLAYIDRMKRYKRYSVQKRKGLVSRLITACMAV